METIIQKYFLETGSHLVSHTIGVNGVDCWFDTEVIRQHRCLSFDDFDLIKAN